jgi:iron-sulfur cluster repair protein YtfE (RIC family)
MTATDIFRKNHRTIRKALVTLDRALLMKSQNWAIIAKNLAGYLEIELREYWGSEERWIFKPLAGTGPDAAGVVAQMEQEHRDLDTRLNEFKGLTRCPIGPDIAPLVQEKGVALVKEFLHHVSRRKVGFSWAERLG